MRLDVRRAETLKVGGEPIGSHTRVKIVKNKVAPPFKEAEFDVIYGQGISHDSELVDLAVKLDIVQKSGAWFSYKEDRLGQGKENTKDYLRAHPELMAEIEEQVRAGLPKLNPSAVKAPAPVQQPVEIPIEAAAKVTAPTAKAQIDIVVDD